MAINRIGGELLESNLIRNTDLAFNTNLLYLDVANGRIGVKTDSPGNFALDVNGTSRFQGNVLINADLTVVGTTTTIDSQNLSVEDNILVINSNNSADTDAGIMINRGGANDPAVFYWDETVDKFRVGTTTSDGSTRTDLTNVTLAKLQIADPVADEDATTKKYVDDQISSVSSSGVTGDNVQLRYPADSSFGDGAWLGLTASTSVTDAIDDLNETISNVQAGTYIQSVSFTADQTSISLGDTVTLTITTVPTAGANTRYTIDWGTGDTTTGTSDSTPSYTYNENSGTPYTVTVKAYESDAAVTDSAGSYATQTRTDYIGVATLAPEVSFAVYAASSGGSPITTADNGSTVWLQNNTTNTSGATVTYDIDWGDSSESQISGDGVAGGSSLNGGTRISHTYTNSAGDDGSTVAGTGSGDTKYQIRVRLLTHSTAAPEILPVSATSNFEVYSTHTVAYSVTDSTIRGVNEEATSGFPVTFTNDTATDPGANSAFSATQQYTWDFGEGDSNTVVAVGSGSPGDTGQTISNTFNLSSGQQSAGTTVTYTTSLSLANGHTTSPFSANLNIIVEPDVRANIAGTAVTVSDRTGDNQYDLYDFTDLSGNNRALVRFTNSSQNADDYFYDYYDDSSSTSAIVEDGSTAGTIGGDGLGVPLDKDYTGASNGSINFRFRAHGTPDTIEQDDEATLTFTMNATPSAPSNLSASSITLSDSAQGTSPKLCAGFDDASATNPLSAGASLNTTTARRYTTATPIDTSTVNNAYNGAAGTLTAVINGVDRGNVTFDKTDKSSTYTSLVVSQNGDAHSTISAATYPTDFYWTFDAKITQALSSYSVGVNDQRLEHSATGNTNYVSVVRDDITATPTTTLTGSITETAGLSGTDYRYISGIPYYGRNNPSITISGVTVDNFTGQAYQDTSTPIEVAGGTNQESTSGNVLASNPTTFTYAQADGSSSMLTGGIPNVDTGVSSAYALGNLVCPIIEIDDSTSVKSIQTIKIRAKNANGTGSYSSDSSEKIQVYTATPSGLDDENASNGGGITVSDSLGATYDDDAVRIAGFGSLSSDTPALFDSSNANYYTDSAWSGAVTVAGTNEAITRFGTIKHFTTDLSSGYLPVGPDLNTGRNGGEAQYYTLAFRRTNVANFTVTLTGTVSGFFIAAPGTQIDSTSTLNGWLDASVAYAGSGIPGANTGAGGNGSNGCAFTTGDRIQDGVAYSAQSFELTLGSENMSNATGNNVLIRIKLESGDSVTALSIS